jgi:hypothetical protein
MPVARTTAPFVGRERDLAALGELLARERLVVVGASGDPLTRRPYHGVGLTRLVHEYIGSAVERRGRFYPAWSDSGGKPFGAVLESVS